MRIISTDFVVAGGTPLGKSITEVNGFPDEHLLGLWLPTEEGFVSGADVVSLSDLSGNGNDVSLHTTSQVPIATARGLQSPASGVGFMFDTDIPWGQEFSFVAGARITQTPASGSYPAIHQSTASFQVAGMSASNPQTGVTLNVDNQLARADVRPAMFANSSPANFGGTPRKGVNLPAAGQDAWFIAAWSFDPATKKFIFRAKASGGIMGTTSDHEATADYLAGFGGRHAFGLSRFTTSPAQGEFHGSALYDAALPASGLDDLITRMAISMRGAGIDSV